MQLVYFSFSRFLQFWKIAFSGKLFSTVVENLTVDVRAVSFFWTSSLNFCFIGVISFVFVSLVTRTWNISLKLTCSGNDREGSDVYFLEIPYPRTKLLHSIISSVRRLLVMSVNIPVPTTRVSWIILWKKFRHHKLSFNEHFSPTGGVFIALYRSTVIRALLK
jgi:hypothetical protein